MAQRDKRTAGRAGGLYDAMVQNAKEVRGRKTQLHLEDRHALNMNAATDAAKAADAARDHRQQLPTNTQPASGYMQQQQQQQQMQAQRPSHTRLDV